MPANLKPFLSLAALLMLCATATFSQAAGAGVVDNAHILKPDTVISANQITQQIKSQQKHNVRVETYSAIPDDLKARYTPGQKAQFFVDWADRIGKENSVKGIVILICMDPTYIQVVVGNEPRQRAFTIEDRDSVRNELLSAFRQKNYDAGILDALRTIQSRMAANIGSSGSAAAPVPKNSGGGYSAPSNPSVSIHGFGFGGWICLGVGAIIIIMLVAGILNRSRGYGAPPPGGYPPGYVGGGGYPPGYSGGGGGFGRGLLGGLLGGALGAWGYDRMTHGNQSGGGHIPPSTGGTNDADSGSPGGDFNSSTPDVGGGGDFGSDAGGGADSGGGDFGGGGDSGGGGGDFGGGGGGDSGGGGDF